MKDTLNSMQSYLSPINGRPSLLFKTLEILFSSQGSIKKVKIYVNPDGTKKGDALVTYTRAEAAAMAVVQVRCLVRISID